MTRATALTFSECVRRLCMTGPTPVWGTTWVTAESLAKYEEKRIRSRSTRNS